MNRIAIAIVALFLLAPLAPASAHGPDGKGSAMFEAYEKGGIPDTYKGKKNPLEADAGDVDAGMQIYQRSCVMCHGANADGKGHMAQMLEPFPANLRQMVKAFPDIDDYYFWTIKDGGAAFDVPMPGFGGGTLSDTEIWQVISWMQAGFPGTDGEIQDHMQGDMPGHMMPQGGGQTMPQGGGQMPGTMMRPGQMMGQ